MALELAEVVAGFPLAASFAIAGGISALREGRRRAALNEAMHELRRPLQALALSLPADSPGAASLDSSLRMAAAAVERLDREINGEAESNAIVSLSPRSLVEVCVERWRPAASLAGRTLRLRWEGGGTVLRGDEVELEQALDNMISNALEHGEGAVTVAVREEGGLLRLAVLDEGRVVSGSRRRPSLLRRLGGRSRHGHGLRIVRSAAARHGGSFRLRQSPAGTEARLELPLAGGAR